MLVFGGLVFWSAVVILFLIITYCIETDFEAEISWPSFWFVAGLAGIIYSWKKDFLVISSDMDWVVFAVGVAAYLAAGCLWLLFKWRQYSKFKYAKYLKEVERYKRDKYQSGPSMENFIPRIKEHVASINSWILFWPFSVVRYVVNNLLSDFLEMLRNKLTDALNSVARSQFKEVK